MLLHDEIPAGGPGREDLWWVAHPGRSIAEPGVGAGLTQSSLDDLCALINLVPWPSPLSKTTPGTPSSTSTLTGPGNGHQPVRPQGAVIHTRYDLPSVVRSINDALANPMYDAFTVKTLSTVPVT